jgi:hypothetical protein
LTLIIELSSIFYRRILCKINLVAFGRTLIRNNRFIFFNDTVIIVDFKFYVDHAAEIEQWLEIHNGKRQGLVIDFADSNESILFLLRWS